MTLPPDSPGATGLTLLLAMVLAATTGLAQTPSAPDGPKASPYAQWSHGLPADANYFPIAVWLQSTGNAAKYKAAGINLYIGLWKGPTEEQLAALKRPACPSSASRTRWV